MYRRPIPEGPGSKTNLRDMDQQKYTLQTGEIIKALHAYLNPELPSPSDSVLHPFSPENWFI